MPKIKEILIGRRPAEYAACLLQWSAIAIGVVYYFNIFPDQGLILVCIMGITVIIGLLLSFITDCLGPIATIAFAFAFIVFSPFIIISNIMMKIDKR